MTRLTSIFQPFLAVLVATAVVGLFPSSVVADQFRSNGTGNWGTNGTWQISTNGGATWGAATRTPGSAANDTVLIRNGHTVTLNQSPSNAIALLNIGEGTSGILRLGNNNTARTLTINGTVSVAAGGSFDVNTASNTTHTITVGGHVTNNGTLNFATDANSFATLTLNGSLSQTVGGANAVTVRNLTVSNTAAVVSFNTNIDVGGTFTVSANATVHPDAAVQFNGSAPAGTITGSGTIRVTRIAATPDYATQYRFSTNTLTNLTVDYAGAGDQTINAGVGTYGALITSGSGTKTLAGAVSVSADITIGTGTVLDASPSNFNITLGGNWTNNGGTFTPRSATVTFNSTTAAQAINGTATSQTFNNLTVAKSSQTLSVGGSTTALTLNGTMTLTSGAFSAGTAATINVAGDWTNNGGTFIPGMGTVTFNSTTAAQSINGTATSQTFNNLTVAKSSQTLSVGGSTTTLTLNGTVTLTSGTFSAGTATMINIAGNWTNNGGTFTAGSGTVALNGAGAQAISGSATSTFNNLTLSNTSAAISASSDFNVSGTLTVAANAILNPSAGVVINSAAAQGTITGTGTVRVTRTATTADYSSQYRFTTNSLTNLTVDYTASGQVLSNLTYGNLRVSGSITGGGNTATVGGAFTVTGTFTPTSGTLTMTGTAWSVNNSGTLTFSGLTIAGTPSTQPSTSFSLAGALTVNSGVTLAPTGGTITMTGTGWSITNNGTLAFRGLTIAGTPSVQPTASFSVAATFTVNSGVTFAPTSGTVTMTGSSIAGSGTVVFNNLSVSSAVTSSLSFTVNGTLTLNNNLAMGSNMLTMGATATTAGTGDVTGSIRRTTFVAGTPYSFGNPFTSLTLSFTSAPSEGIINIAVGSAPPEKTDAILRVYDITLTGGSGVSATVRLHYLDAELNGNTATNLVLWKYDTESAAFIDQGRTGAVNTTDKWVEKADVSSFSRWTLANQPTIQSTNWTGGAGNSDWNNPANWTNGVPSATKSAIIGISSPVAKVPTTGATTYDLTINSSGTLLWEECGGTLQVYGSVLVRNGGILDMGLTCEPPDHNKLVIEGSLSINNGGVVKGGTGTITIKGALIINNPGSTFDAQLSTVVIDGPGSIQNSITFYNLEVTENGSLSVPPNVHVVVTNDFDNDGSTTVASTGSLTVYGTITGNYDSVKPYMVSATPVTLSLIELKYNEVVTHSTSTNENNYSLAREFDPSSTIAIDSVRRDDSDRSLVRIYLASAMTQDTSYMLTVSNVADSLTGGDVIQPGSKKRVRAILRLTFFSRASSNWSDANTWSTTGLGGSPASRAPGAAATDSIVIGNSHAITLDVDANTFSGIRVLSTGTLLLGTRVLSGSGSFTLDADGTLGIGSAAGITSSGASGNIQVTSSRTFSTGANYTYNGTSAQVTGDGLPASVNNLTINNTGPSTVTLTNSVTVSGTFTLSAGTFAIGSNTLTLNGSVSGGGTLTSGVAGTVVYNQSSHGQSVLAANYGNLTFSDFNKTLSASAVGVAGTFTPGNATGHSIAGSTIEFNGSSQNIPSFNGTTGYFNISMSNTGTKTIVGNLNAGGNFTVASGVSVVIQSGANVQITGNVYNDGTVTNNGVVTVGN